LAHFNAVERLKMQEKPMTDKENCRGGNAEKDNDGESATWRKMQDPTVLLHHAL